MFRCAPIFLTTSTEMLTREKIKKKLILALCAFVFLASGSIPYSDSAKASTLPAIRVLCYIVPSGATSFHQYKLIGAMYDVDCLKRVNKYRRQSTEIIYGYQLPRTFEGQDLLPYRNFAIGPRGVYVKIYARWYLCHQVLSPLRCSYR